MRGVPLFNQDGSLREWIGTVKDINDKKKAEKYLQRYRLLSEKAGDIVWIIRPNGDILEVNQTAVNTYGYSREELLQMNVRDLCEPEALSTLTDDLEKALAEGIKFETRHTRKDGTIFAVEVNANGADFDDERLIMGIVRDISERKSVEIKLRDSENRLQLALDSAQTGIHIWNIQENTLLWDDRLREFWGLAPDDMVTFNTFTNGLHPDDFEQTQNAVDVALNPENDGNYFAEYRVIGKTDGKIRWISATGKVFFENGIPQRLIGTARDITNRKNIETILQEQQRFTQNIIEATPALTYIYDLVLNKNIFISEQSFELLGYTIEEIQAMESNVLPNLIHPDDKEPVAKRIEKILADTKNDIFEIEYRMQRKDGEWIWLWSRDRIFRRNADGKPIQMLGVATDITERKAQEVIIRRSEAEFRHLANAVPQIVWVAGTDGKTQYVNEQWIEFSGLNIEETATPEILSKIIHPDDRAKIFGEWEKAFTEGLAYEVEGRMRNHKTSKFQWFLMRSEPTKNEFGQVVQWFGTSTDISIQKETELKLRETEERFSKAFNASPLVLTISSLETGKLTEVNDTFVKVTGYSRSEAIGKTTIELGLWKNKKDRDSELDMVRQTGHLSNSEYLFQTKAGIEIVGLLAAEKIEIGGKPFALTVIQDITERKLIEEKLLRSNEFHTVIANISSDWGFSARVEPDGSVMTDAIIGGFTKQLGYQLDEMIENGGWESIVHPDDLPAAAEQMKKLMRGETIRGKLRHISKAGHTIVSEYQTSPIVDKNGKVVRVYGANRDITSQILSEQLIRDSESRLRTIIESAIEYAIFTLTLEGNINSWSPGAEKIFGYTENEIIGQKVDILFTPTHRENNVPAREMQTALIKGRAADDHFHLRKDGSKFFASGVMMPILRNGATEGFVKIVRDMTAQILAEKTVRDKEILQKLVTAQENERRRIARDLHDELGQQLTALRLNLENTSRMFEDQKVKTEIDKIQAIAQQIDYGVDFLAWELRPAVLDDLGLYAAFEKFISEWTNYSGIKAELLPTSLKGIRFNSEIETNLYRILQEALNNINKHGKANYTEILFEKRDDSLMLIIADDGIGFNPKTTRTLNKGIGIVGMQERAILIGGTLEIESTPGQGTTLYIKVPELFSQEEN